MKITNVRTALVDVPLEKPITTAIHAIRSLGCVLVFVETDEGITGENLAFTLNGQRLSVLHEMVRSLAPLVVGKDPEYTERFWVEAWSSINFLGHKGVSVAGISAIDGALWDIKGKAAGRPIHQLVGAVRGEIPAYHSGGLWLSQTPRELADEAERFRKAGFTAMKVRIGKPSITEDIERVHAVRDAIGSETTLMADANQSFTVSHAIRLGRRLEAFDLAWFEEPLPAYDLEGSGRVAAALDVPIASGETEYTRYGFREMLRAMAADIWMPDLQRVGGVTEFLKVGHLAQAYDIPISSHIFSEQSLQLLGSLANATYLEYMPWWAPLYREEIEFRNGNAVIPTRPGWGFTFDPSVVERLRA